MRETHESNDVVQKYRMFYLKSALTTTAFLSVGSYQYKKSNKKFSFIRKNVQTALQQVLKMSTTFSKTRIHPKFCYLSEYVVVLFYSFLSGYILLNVSQTAANNFSAELYSRTNTPSALLLVYTLCFALVQLLHNWHEQRCSRRGVIDSSAITEVRRVCYTGLDLFLFCTILLDCC
jgi:hypothetical protein